MGFLTGIYNLNQRTGMLSSVSFTQLLQILGTVDMIFKHHLLKRLDKINI